MPQKRTLESFFQPASKEPRLATHSDSGHTQCEPFSERSRTSSLPPSAHASYPFPIPQLPESTVATLSEVSGKQPKAFNEEPDLDVLYYAPYIPASISKDLFNFLRRELPFYRVQYTIKRGSIETPINTPRFTTVFGVDTSARFTEQGQLVSAASKAPLPRDYYSCQPRPIPACLDVLRILTEASTGATYNFALVNYYATGADSISYHSDDERFLGPEPTIASFSLGAARDFLLKHKPPPGDGLGAQKTLSFKLGSGDMVLMRGRTQACWLHSIPKRKSGAADGGRINITFRKALIRGGTENYYRYNVGDGGVFRWDERRREMVPWGG